MSEEIKRVNISGPAALEVQGGQKRTRKTAKKNQAGGVNLVRGVESSSLASTAASPISTTWLKYPTNAPVPPASIIVPSHIPSKPEQAAAPTNQYTVPQQGGTKQIKVELKKKSSAKKVHLQPKKSEAPKVHFSSKKNTRKVRKVTLGVSSLHKRMTRAKKLHKHIKEMPIDKLKEKLVKSGLIKTSSKAPESILRQIASDAEVVAKKAL